MDKQDFLPHCIHRLYRQLSVLSRTVCGICFTISIIYTNINNRRPRELVKRAHGHHRISSLKKNGSSLAPLAGCCPYIWTEGDEWMCPTCIKKNPVGKKSMVVRIHSGPSLKAFPVAIWVGSLIRQATSSSCTNYSEKLAGSDIGLNRCLCSPFQISITYVYAILPVRARLSSLTRG